MKAASWELRACHLWRGILWLCIGGSAAAFLEQFIIDGLCWTRIEKDEFLVIGLLKTCRKSSSTAIRTWSKLWKMLDKGRVSSLELRIVSTLKPCSLWGRSYAMNSITSVSYFNTERLPGQSGACHQLWIIKITHSIRRNIATLSFRWHSGADYYQSSALWQHPRSELTLLIRHRWW